MEKKHTLVDNAAEKRYELDLGDEIALAEYIPRRGHIVLTHIEVPAKYEGRGIGKELVQGVLEEIRRKELKVVPQCPFAAAYIRRHPEWMDLVLTAGEQ
ncbi:GNAT family N-acetyltransferase [Alistipes sp.]|uniref:GNAT family N-acetyltransferase n=1 Tax=Alistipes sp. TaxID=1872444 RepID=UPI0025C489F8|nr:GNAT family N-acetyltransferase [Alistipes sp.]